MFWHIYILSNVFWYIKNKGGAKNGGNNPTAGKGI